MNQRDDLILVCSQCRLHRWDSQVQHSAQFARQGQHEIGISRRSDKLAGRVDEQGGHFQIGSQWGIASIKNSEFSGWIITPASSPRANGRKKRTAIFIGYKTVYVGGIGLKCNILNSLQKSWKGAESDSRLSGLPQIHGGEERFERRELAGFNEGKGCLIL